MKSIGPDFWQKIGDASTLGLVLATSIFIGFFMGFYLDKIFNTKPWLMFVFLMLGIVSGFLNIFKYVKKWK